MSNENLVNRLIDAMKQQIETYGLELLQRYPNDLLVHDRSVLERFATAGASIAWMVGHCHTHIVCLGLHQKENEMTAYLTNMGNDDRFYLIRIHTDDNFTFKEVDRKQFAALSNTPVSYSMDGVPEAFWLLRGNDRLGYCKVERTGTMQDLIHNVTITPVAGASALDIAALTMWSEKAAVKVAGSLFVRTVTTWAEPMRKVA